MTDNIDSKYSSFLSYSKYALYATTATVFTPLLVLGLLAKLSMAYFVIDGASLLALMLLDYSGSKKLPQIEVPQLTAPPTVQPVASESAVSLSDFAKFRKGLDINIIQIFGIYLQLKNPEISYTALKLNSCSKSLTHFHIERGKKLNCAYYNEFIKLKQDLDVEFFHNEEQKIIPFINFSEQEFQDMKDLLPQPHSMVLDNLLPELSTEKQVCPEDLLGEIGFLDELKRMEEELYISDKLMSFRYVPEDENKKNDLLEKIENKELQEKVRQCFDDPNTNSQFDKGDRNTLGSSFKKYFMLSDKITNNFSLFYWRNFELTEQEVENIVKSEKSNVLAENNSDKEINNELKDGNYIIRTGDIGLGHYIAMKKEDKKATIWDSLHSEVSDDIKEVLRKYGITEFESVKKGKLQMLNDCGGRSILAVRGEFYPKHNNAQHELEEEFKDFYRWLETKEAIEHTSAGTVDATLKSLDEVGIKPNGQLKLH